jgi:hypothetical protein
MPNAPRRPRATARDETADTAITPPVDGGRSDPVGYAWGIAGLMAAIGAVVGMLFLHYRSTPRNFGSPAELKLLSLLLLALAIERALEPVNHFLQLGGDTSADPLRRPVRAALCLGLASAVAMIACGFFGIGVFHAFGDDGAARYIDVIVSGLGIGAATKPLHDVLVILDHAARRRTAPPG